MQVFDTVGYLTQLDVYQVMNYTDETQRSFSPDLNGWNPPSHPRSNIYALRLSTVKQDMVNYRRLQYHKTEPHNRGRGNTRKQLHGRACYDRNQGPTQEYFQIPKTRQQIVID